MVSLRSIAAVLFLLSFAFNSAAQDNDYHKLSLQEKADLARYLGWVWGDGRPGFNGIGILYKGGNANYKATVTRLANIRFDGKTNPLGFPESGDRRLNYAWEYWEHSLPGGNAGDPEILREAIRHPNFLAGIIEGEGQVHHSNAQRDFYIDDHSFAPSHPDKIYGIANFGPERSIQLFNLIGETYGFYNSAISIGKTKYQYDTQRCEAIERIRALYKERKKQNESGNLQPAFTVKIYVKPTYFDEIRSYGYFRKGDGKYRTPAPDSKLKIINTSESDLNTEADGPMTFLDNVGNAGTRLIHSSGYYLNSDLDIVWADNNGDTYWKLIDLGTGYYRIQTRDSSKSKRWLQALDNAELRMTDESSTWHRTQWKKIPVLNTNDRYYLKNRHHGTSLRVATSNSILKHGPAGPAAQWTLTEHSACTQ